MAIIVDKDKKREDIALSCKDLVVNSDINSLTISTIAKEAGIGKGTFYEYFKDKYELVFEIVNILMKEHNIKKEKKLKLAKSTREKIKIFIESYYIDEFLELRETNKKLIALSILSQNEKMLEFETNIYNFFKNWANKEIEEAIKARELKPIAKDFVEIVYSMAKGMFITSLTTKDAINLKDSLDKSIDTIFDLVEEKR